MIFKSLNSIIHPCGSTRLSTPTDFDSILNRNDTVSRIEKKAQNIGLNEDLIFYYWIMSLGKSYTKSKVYITGLGSKKFGKPSNSQALIFYQ